MIGYELPLRPNSQLRPVLSAIETFEGSSYSKAHSSGPQLRNCASSEQRQTTHNVIDLLESSKVWLTGSYAPTF